MMSVQSDGRRLDDDVKLPRRRTDPLEVRGEGCSHTQTPPTPHCHRFPPNSEISVVDYPPKPGGDGRSGTRGVSTTP